MGLMPHPEHAVEPAIGGTDGLVLLGSLVDRAVSRRGGPRDARARAEGRSRARARAWAHARGVAEHPVDPGPRAELRGARDLLRDVVRALLLQVEQEVPAAAAFAGRARAPGPRRERRLRLDRRWARGGLQDREPQSSLVHRAPAGRGDRRRRHPAGHLHDGRATDRLARFAALRPARGSEASLSACTAWSMGSAATATRSASPRSAARPAFTSATAATSS